MRKNKVLIPFLEKNFKNKILYKTPFYSCLSYSSRSALLGFRCFIFKKCLV
jgi:hypothetical protein